MPSYTLANFRLGLKGDHWQAAAYVNNFTDKTVPLALDYERGRSARVGYLVEPAAHLRHLRVLQLLEQRIEGF